MDKNKLALEEVKLTFNQVLRDVELVPKDYKETAYDALIDTLAAWGDNLLLVRDMMGVKPPREYLIVRNEEGLKVFDVRAQRTGRDYHEEAEILNADLARLRR